MTNGEGTRRVILRLLAVSLVVGLSVESLLQADEGKPLKVAVVQTVIEQSLDVRAQQRFTMIRNPHVITPVRCGSGL